MLMTCGKKAEENLWNKAIGIVAVAVIDRWLCKDLKLESVKNEVWKIAKYLLKNDEKTQDEVATVIGCKVRSYLN